MIPDISVVIPVYNSEKYIRKCVDSVRKQTHKNIEIILVDDGSRDNSPEICKEFEEADSRIRVLHQQNGGASRARNAGIRRSRGKYVCFVDSDDFVAEDYCEVMLKLLEQSGCDYCVCGSYRFVGDNEKTVSFSGVDGLLSNEEYLWAQLDRKSEFGFYNKLFRREIFDRLHFYEGVHNEDVIFSCDLARCFHSGVVCTKKELYAYRMNESGITFGQKRKADPDFLFAARYLIETAQILRPQRMQECLLYAIGYPWFFVDKIYLERSFRKNKVFLNELRSLICDYFQEYSQLEDGLDAIKRHRILLFAKRPVLYEVNVYIRLLRLYIYKILKKDPYVDGHGI